jgi:hypothetical protein
MANERDQVSNGFMMERSDIETECGTRKKKPLYVGVCATHDRLGSRYPSRAR